MKTQHFIAATALLSAFHLAAWATFAATTINPANNSAYGANFGWINARGDVANGAVIGQFVCSGYLWGANIGWISLGSGAPTNGIRYQNLSADDFGVNHNGAGGLSGYAWASNIGWINFTNHDAGGAPFDGPKVDLATGRLSGSVWSANCGWVSLSNAVAFVQTDSIYAGSDADGNGIPDAWERLYFGTNGVSAGADADGDGISHLQEYLADTDPLDANSALHITTYSVSLPLADTNTMTWTSRPTRLYRWQYTTNLEATISWTTLGSLFPPDPGETTTAAVAFPEPAPRRFLRVQAVLPLSP